MNYSNDKSQLTHAIQLGCKTAGQFAQLLKARASIQKATS